MNILEWMEGKCRYNFEDTTLQTIAFDREIDTNDDATSLTTRNTELLMADIIFTALILSPSSTSSQLLSHNNFQKNVGSESVSETKRKYDLKFMESIYKKYDDPKYYLLNDSSKYIRIIPIEDII